MEKQPENVTASTVSSGGTKPGFSPSTLELRRTEWHQRAAVCCI
jgi:hypothetical protein